MTKKDLPACPVEITMGLIGEKWKVLIIRDLLTGTKRFGELRKSVTGITQKVLTNNLRQMEAFGLVKRKVYAEVPPRVEYSLTETGLSLKPILDSMVKWGNEYREKSSAKQYPPEYLMVIFFYFLLFLRLYFIIFIILKLTIITKIIEHPITIPLLIFSIS